MKVLRNKRGQTMVEYLLLLGTAFITAYLVVTGPLADFSVNMLIHIQGSLGNTTNYGEWQVDPIKEGSSKHPASAERLNPLHL